MFRKSAIVSAIGLLVFASTPCSPQTPGEAANASRVECAEQTYTTVTGTIESLDLQDPVRWLITVTQDQMGGCRVNVLTVSNRPAPSCQIGRKITASGRVFLSNYLMVDSFSCR
jgi:hypothetical protein